MGVEPTARHRYRLLLLLLSPIERITTTFEFTPGQEHTIEYHRERRLREAQNSGGSGRIGNVVSERTETGRLRQDRSGVEHG